MKIFRRGSWAFLALVGGSGCSADFEATDASVSAQTVLGLPSDQPKRSFVAALSVQSLAPVGNTLYFAGPFLDYVGQRSGAFVAFDKASGLRDKSFPEFPAGAVNALIEDGNAGAFVAGDQTIGVVHVPSDRTIASSFNVAVQGGGVTALALDGDRLYVGGFFTSINGVARRALAVVDRHTGALLAEHPSVLTASVTSLLIWNRTLLVGGSFSSNGGQAGLSTVDLDTGLSTSFAPAPIGGAVMAMERAGNTLYIAGSFTVVGGVSRNRLAAIDLSTMSLLPWNPSSSSIVRSMALVGSTVYVSGDFVRISGTARNRAAALDATSGALLPWNSGLGDVSIKAWALGAQQLYAAHARGIVAFDRESGAATGFSASSSGAVTALMATDSHLLAGGQFTSVNGRPRRGAAALDLSSRRATNFKPNVTGTVNAIAADEGAAYVAGNFRAVTTTTRFLAAFDALSSLPLPWDPKPNAEVTALALSGSTLYVGGRFTLVDGQPRSHLAAVDTLTGALSPLQTTLSLNGTDAFGIAEIVRQENRLYVLGGFNQVNGEARPGLAALDAVTGALQSWNPNASSVKAIAASGDVVYLAGGFKTVNGVARTSLAAVDANTGELLPWQPSLQLQSFDAILSDGQVVYVGGRNGAAAFDANTGERLPWNPEFGGSVTRFAFGPSELAVAGTFFRAGSTPQQGLALFERTPQ